MRTIPHKLFLTTLGLIASATLTVAQSANQAAVDTLTKGVAAAVFANINQPKAQEIYTKLLNCGDECDPQQVIRGVGSWDQVGAKMQELSELKNTAKFVSLSPGEANTAIRKQLALFYARYKNDKNYGKPLSPAVQTQLLAKVDAMLPPGEVVETAPTTTSSPAATQPESDEEINIPSTTLQISRLESQVKNEQEKQFWMILVSAFVGLLGGAAAVYFLLFRATKAEADRLRFENSQLSRSLDAAQRNKPTNERRQPQDVDRQKANAYDSILAELGTTVDPLVAIRQLKQQAPVNTPKNPPVERLEESINEPVTTPESIPLQNQLRSTPDQQLSTPPTRSEVFYFPPPDQNGQFDIAQKSSTLSPESAYRFSVSADNPAIATFRFEAEPGRVTRFMTYRNYMIEPACESENSYMNVHTRIAMRRDGEATLENGTWRVKTKALIRYE